VFKIPYLTPGVGFECKRDEKEVLVVNDFVVVILILAPIWVPILTSLSSYCERQAESGIARCSEITFNIIDSWSPSLLPNATHDLLLETLMHESMPVI
jgi:hypothetical protein